MAVTVAATVRRARCAFDGQSLNNVPGPVTTFPYRVMRYFANVPYSIPAFSGQSFTTLTPTAAQRTDIYAALAPYTIICLCGGTSDLGAPESNTGAQVYADMGAYATARRAAGFDYVIGTTITPSTGFSGPEETQRVAANSLIMADASDYFDAQCDIAGIPQLANPADTTYYFDGLHYTGAATTLIADLLRPFIATALAAAP